ncbi:class I SAM-dependent methyltransferase [Prochlorococcus sp. MIT 1223]|uniref:class I SAM-dependent methyltransferase n=1 Tax=Prochlorococcus sp. MIT 1223 TaxID=3096217 RepID=UPI002A7482AF|nr:class I SAM-dependent methyltransferase [Prochlorococcus sp. MIT 1223]
MFKIQFDSIESIGPLERCYFKHETSKEKNSEGQNEYTLESSIQFYRNYLSWFYDTFNLTETSLRNELFSELSLNNDIKILITGVGLGHEIEYLIDRILTRDLQNITIVAQDHSDLFVDYIFNRIKKNNVFISNKSNLKLILFNGDACNLPLLDNVFDYCHHFGGINRFHSIRLAVSEMSRVLKNSSISRVMFSDESVAPWLRDHDIGKMIMENNSLYAAKCPIKLLPKEASNVKLEWIVQNSFYKISFGNTFKEEHINSKVVHNSPRGGSMYSRYYGKLESISPELRDIINQKAKARGLSFSDMITNLIKKSIEDY